MSDVTTPKAAVDRALDILRVARRTTIDDLTLQTQQGRRLLREIGIPRPDPVETPLTDEQVAAEMWRLSIETPWERAHPEIQKLMIGQVAQVRRALASLAGQDPVTPEFRPKTPKEDAV